jgi:hypothetical protein
MKPKQIQLLWDFRGQASEPTATHFLEHLHQYLNQPNNQDVNHTDSGTKVTNESLCSVFLNTSIESLEKLKSDLKPHRGVYIDDSTGSA